MKNKGRKIILFIIIVLICISVIGFPAIIFCGMKQNWYSFLANSKMTIGDIMTYCGTIFASIITICGVAYTIIVTQAHHSENIRNSSLPYMSLFVLRQRRRASSLFFFNGIKFTERDDINSNTSENSKVTNLYFIINDGEITLKDALTKTQEELVQNGGFREETTNGVASVIAAGLICQSVEIENVGKGPAISLRVGLNKNSDDTKYYTYGIPIKIGEKVRVCIYSEGNGTKSANYDEYELGLKYNDIYGNVYMQTCDIILKYSDEDNCPVFQIYNDEIQHRYTEKQ